MSDEPRKISKSQGRTPSEASLARFCDDTFLKLWSYANPFKSDGKELCDLIAIFENHVFLFFDRESRTFDTIVPRHQRHLGALEKNSNRQANRYRRRRRPVYSAVPGYVCAT